jgi:hypothetical protein
MLALAVAFAGVGWLAAPAIAAPVFSATLFEESGGVDPAWTAGAGDRFFIYGHSRRVTVEVRDAADRLHSFAFASPPPALLRTGVYDRADEAFTERGQPGIDVSRPQAGCNQHEGRFEI